MSTFGKFKDLISSKLLSLEGEIREEFVKFEEELGIRKEPENAVAIDGIETTSDEESDIVAAPVEASQSVPPVPVETLPEAPTPVHVESVVEAQVVSATEDATA